MNNFLVRIGLLRFFDIVLSLIGLFLLWPVILVCYMLQYNRHKTGMFFQKRVGRNSAPFIIYKIRTLPVNAPSAVPTHLVSQHIDIDSVSQTIRNLKIDELPQLINVLMGSMSFVGPRPCLLSQLEIIKLRNRYCIDKIRPGITGFAQMRSCDMSSVKKLIIYDKLLTKNLSISKYFYCIIYTIFMRK